MADQCNPCLADKGAESGAEGQVTLAQAVGTGVGWGGEFQLQAQAGQAGQPVTRWF